MGNREPAGSGYAKFKTDQRQSAVITKNMRALLFCLLSSVKFEDGHAKVVFEGECKGLMDTFQFEDVVDCHTRLNLPEGYGAGVCKRSRIYVINKMERMWRNGK